MRGEPRLGPVARRGLAPDPDALASLRRVVRRWLQEAGAEPDEVHALVMAANEACQNALEHGTGFARTTSHVDLELVGDEVRITVRDAGRRERSPADPDRGRGIELMRALTDEVSLELAPHGSVVRLRRRLRGGGGEADSEAGRVADGEPGVAPGVR